MKVFIGFIPDDILDFWKKTYIKVDCTSSQNLLIYTKTPDSSYRSRPGPGFLTAKTTIALYDKQSGIITYYHNDIGYNQENYSRIIKLLAFT